MQKPGSGWLVVLAAFFGVMAGFGSLVVFTFSVLLKPISAEFGWSREAGFFSTLYGFTWTAYPIAGAIGPVVMGRVFDLTGSYAVFLPVLACVGLVSAFLMLTMPRYDRKAAPVSLAVPAVTSPSDI